MATSVRMMAGDCNPRRFSGALSTNDTANQQPWQFADIQNCRPEAYPEYEFGQIAVDEGEHVGVVIDPLTELRPVGIQRSRYNSRNPLRGDSTTDIGIEGAGHLEPNRRRPVRRLALRGGQFSF